MDQLKFVETALKIFTWSTLDYLDPNEGGFEYGSKRFYGKVKLRIPTYYQSNVDLISFNSRNFFCQKQKMGFISLSGTVT